VGIEQNGCPATALGLNNVADHSAAKGIEARGWFVEENQFRVVEQGLREADTLQHSLGELLQALVTVRRESHEVEEFATHRDPSPATLKIVSISLEEFATFDTFANQWC
jgi:hypothetical protein